MMCLLVTDHIGAELEENLGAIEEVTGYVKIVRSYALLSLRFLKSLSVIGGERLYDNRWALVLVNETCVGFPRILESHGI